MPRVLFVSKPMSPPFRDGSKCLVRDICNELSTIEAHLMATQARSSEISSRVHIHTAYRSAGSFAPGLMQNAQAFAWLLASPRVDIWHSIFAPNPRSSQVLGALARLRRVRVCQTIASPPRNFQRPERLLFGDTVVAQSSWTMRQFEQSFAAQGRVAPKMVEIPPPCPRLEVPSTARLDRLRAELGLERSRPLFLYPGDLEVSSAAQRLCEWSQEIQSRVPGARLVVAYRDKTSQSANIARRLAEGVDPKQVTFFENVSDIAALVALSRAVLFPVDDLYGKVDLPIILLEALLLGTPVLALDQGPLASLKGGLLLDAAPQTWVQRIEDLEANPQLRAQLIASGKKAAQEHYAPERVALEYQRIYADLMREDTRSHRPLVMQ